MPTLQKGSIEVKLMGYQSHENVLQKASLTGERNNLASKMKSEKIPETLEYFPILILLLPNIPNMES